MPLSPETRVLSRRLLSYEVKLHATSEPIESAAFLVSEKLRRSLCALAGVAGYRSLISRALTLAKAEAPELGAIQIAPDGSLQGLSELDLLDEKNESAGAVLVAYLLGLLFIFIGEALTLRLVRDEWPDVVFDDGESGKETNA